MPREKKKKEKERKRRKKSKFAEGRNKNKKPVMLATKKYSLAFFNLFKKKREKDTMLFIKKVR